MIAIDLGSNTIRFVEFDGEKWGRDFEKIVRTAEALNVTGRIGDNALRRIIDAIEEAKTRLDFTAQPVRGYTTAAMRLASNASEVLETIERETGIGFDVIDAQREADLTLRAVRYRLEKLAIAPNAFVLADIGGGSTELIVTTEESARSISLNTGIVTLAECSQSLEGLRGEIEAFSTQVRDALTVPRDASFVLTAGTPTTMAAYLLGMEYATYDPSRINGYRLSRDACLRVYDELLDMPENFRTRYVGVGRENLIIAGILMVTAIYDALGFSEAIIVDDGLREGIALDFFVSL